MLNVYQLYNCSHPCITARRLHHGSRVPESGCNLGSFLVSHFVLVKWSRKWNRKPLQSESSRCKCSTSNLDGPFAGYCWQVKLRPPPMLPRTLEPPPISSIRISDILWHIFPFMGTSFLSWTRVCKCAMNLIGRISLRIPRISWRKPRKALAKANHTQPTPPPPLRAQNRFWQLDLSEN